MRGGWWGFLLGSSRIHRHALHSLAPLLASSVVLGLASSCGERRRWYLLFYTRWNCDVAVACVKVSAAAGVAWWCLSWEEQGSPQ